MTEPQTIDLFYEAADYDTVARLLDQMTPQQLWAIYQLIPGRVQDADHPPVTVSLTTTASCSPAPTAKPPAGRKTATTWWTTRPAGGPTGSPPQTVPSTSTSAKAPPTRRP